MNHPPPFARLLVALNLVAGKECLMVGNLDTGYIVAPHDAKLEMELKDRSMLSDRDATQWVHTFRW